MSPRDNQLVLSGGELPTTPTLTVELYEKWYDLYLVAPDGTVTEVSFGDLEDRRYCAGDQTAVADHVPNPVVVAAYAQFHEYWVDNLAYELMVGRWEISAEENYV